MARLQVLLALVVCAAVVLNQAAALYEAEKQIWVWPKPSSVSHGDSSVWLDEYTFAFRTSPNSFTHDILTQAFKRYSGIIRSNKGVRTFPSPILDVIRL